LKIFRSGIGYDVHELVKGRALVLGGVHIDSEFGLLGHSDADVLTHAIIDALLGAAALGDIGTHFPDTDSKWKNADSLRLLAFVNGKLSEAGYRVVNIDATVTLETPKLRPYIDRMRDRISETLSIHVSDVSVKATTSENMGFVGRREGAAAFATCSICSVESSGKTSAPGIRDVSEGERG
jgi:2-C-methyl-D-erythritol 2,4-cyclodiphosphate synthase